MPHLDLHDKQFAQPQYFADVNWNHPLFSGATHARVFVGSQSVSWCRPVANYATANYSGTAAARSAKAYGLGLESVSTGINHIAPAIQELNSVLVIGYVRTDTEGSANYVGHRYLQPGGNSFGDGGGSTAGNRRDWVWTQANANAPYLVVPAAAPSTAPTVYVAGAKVTVTANASPGSATTYAWGGSTTYYNAGSPFGTQATGLFVAVNWQVPDAISAQVTADPWQLFEPEPIRIYWPSAAAQFNHRVIGGGWGGRVIAFDKLRGNDG